MTRRAVLYLVFAQVVLGLATAPAHAARGRIRPGETVDGHLERGDDRLEEDQYCDTYLIDADVGTVVRITQTSEDVDSYLIVLRPDGTQLENDDYAVGESLDSRLTVFIKERGDYQILCASYSVETGRYEVRVEEIPRPEYYGLFVGIEKYGDEWEDAELCDEDAENMYDAFVDSGLMERDHGIVLTNGGAERRDVENAFNELKREVGRDDVFIFFFSGHGNQVEASRGSRTIELDGLDETIALRDGDLIDDDLADLLEEIDSGLTVVVLDACNSGGIARDIVRGPGIVCFASSEEDVLSDFAPELDAGGYLSVFFREAILGGGDVDGDGMILIGELARYLLRRYYQDGPSPEAAIYGYQELVHERGLVAQDTVFCWWEPGRRPGRVKP
jgi:hypothetical protein